MVNCCENIQFVGCFGSCEAIPLLLQSDYTGVAELQFNWLNRYLTYDIVVEQGEQIVMPNIFNEQSVVVFKIKRSDGTYFTFPEGSESEPVTECFYLKNTLQINISNVSAGAVIPGGNLNVVTTTFNMQAEESVVNIGNLALLPFQLFINGVLQTSPNQYTANGSVITIVDPPFDDYVITILTLQYT